MKQISITRRLNIRHHIKSKHGMLGEIALKIGRNANYLSQLFSPRTKLDISDDVARQLEKALDLPPLALDSPVDSETPDPSVIALTLFELKLNEWFDGELEPYPSLEFNITPRWLIRDSSDVIAVAELANGQPEPLEKRVLAAMIATGCTYGVLGCETPDGLITSFYHNNMGRAVRIDESFFLDKKGVA